MDRDNSSMRRLPLVLLIDLDGTLIGSVKLLLAEYDLHKEAARLSGAESTAAAASRAGRALRDSFVTRLQIGGILRPHVRRFFRRMEQLRADATATPVELFAYTASEDSWAKFIIPCVESAAGARFNRPLFVRSHCAAGGTRKVIAPLLPKIAGALRRRYPHLSAGELVERVLLIDNTPDVMMYSNERDRLVVCPTYNYRHIHDVLGHLSPSMILERPSHVAAILSRNDIDLSHHIQQLAKSRPGLHNTLLAAYYHWLTTTIVKTDASNMETLQSDCFWDVVRKLIASVAKRSTSATLPGMAVRSLNHDVAERLMSIADAR